MSTQPSTHRQADSSSLPAESADSDDDDNRRSDGDRRAEDRRRSARGLFELRARRDRLVNDRRQTERRSPARFRLAFWRRSGA